MRARTVGVWSEIFGLQAKPVLKSYISLPVMPSPKFGDVGSKVSDLDRFQAFERETLTELQAREAKGYTTGTEKPKVVSVLVPVPVSQINAFVRGMAGFWEGLKGDAENRLNLALALRKLAVSENPGNYQYGPQDALRDIECQRPNLDRTLEIRLKALMQTPVHQHKELTRTLQLAGYLGSPKLAQFLHKTFLTNGTAMPSDIRQTAVQAVKDLKSRFPEAPITIEEALVAEKAMAYSA